MHQLRSAAPSWGPVPDRFPWAPVALAAAAVAVTATRLIVWMLGMALYIFVPGNGAPTGFEPLQPTTDALLTAVLGGVILPLLSIAGLLVTWHYAHERWLHACWAAAVVTAVLALASFVV